MKDAYANDAFMLFEVNSAAFFHSCITASHRLQLPVAHRISVDLETMSKTSS